MTTVLIADDEDDVRRAVARVVAGVPFTVLEAADGREALELLDAHEVDVILTDLDMPRMGGIALLHAVASRNADIPVIILTGNPTLETAMAAVREGAFDYLTKPFRPEQVRELVKRAAHLRTVARLRRHAMAVSRLPGGRAEDLEEIGANFEAVLEQLWMAYQPIVAPRDRSVFGHEALLRSPVSALPHPGAVLHAAEYLGRLRDLAHVVRARAPGPMQAEPSRGRLFINLHSEDLLDEQLFDPSTPLSQMAARVVLEITERADLHGVRDLADRIARLRAMGYAIAIDDLGAGYAGLTSFATLRPDFVKLDMSLVRGVDGDPLRQKLVGSMVAVCGEMKIGMIAEGVESESERDALLELGVDLFQGFLFAKPDRPFPDVRW